MTLKDFPDAEPSITLDFLKSKKPELCRYLPRECPEAY